jgi:hypothetical protein
MVLARKHIIFHVTGLISERGSTLLSCPSCTQVPLLQPQLLCESITRVQVLLASAEKQWSGTSLEICAALAAPVLQHLVPLAMHTSQHDGDAGEGEQEQMWYTVAGFLMMLLEPGVSGRHRLVAGFVCYIWQLAAWFMACWLPRNASAWCGFGAFCCIS